MQLHEFQHRFGKLLKGDDTSQVDLPIETRGFSKSQRVAVYRNNVLQVHEQALATAYPVVKRLVGEPFFTTVARDYWDEVTFGSGNIQDYGAGFPDFLRSFTPALSLPYLPDVARLEWLRQQSRVSVDTEAGAPVIVSEPGVATIVLHPSVRLLASPHPVHSIWRFCQTENPDGTLTYDRQPEYVSVHRRDAGGIVMRALTPGEYRLLLSLQSGHEFRFAADAELRRNPGFDVRAALIGWVRDGRVTSAQVDS